MESRNLGATFLTTPTLTAAGQRQGLHRRLQPQVQAEGAAVRARRRRDAREDGGGGRRHARRRQGVGGHAQDQGRIYMQ